MKAIIVCNESTFVAKARSILERVAERVGLTLGWTVKRWSIHALRRATTSEKALLESADAHLVLIPGEYASSLPSHLRDWLERWATLRQVEEAAIGLIDETAPCASTDTERLQLRMLIYKHGLKLITNRPAIRKPRAKLSVTEEREHQCRSDSLIFHALVLPILSEPLESTTKRNRACL
jgi:hypothetical protein